jgi:hypothetical protein
VTKTGHTGTATMIRANCDRGVEGHKRRNTVSCPWQCGKWWRRGRAVHQLPIHIAQVHLQNNP